MDRKWGVALIALVLSSHAHAQDAVGLNVHVPGEDTLDLAAEAGVGWVRMDGNWWQLEPASGDYRWEVLDGAIDGARERGLQVYLTLAYTPTWVAKVPRERSDDYTGNDEPAASTEWARFVEAAVRHYRARGVTHYGLWNEPNLGGFWDGDVDAYVEKIALPGAAAVRRACADCVTLGPDLAHVNRVDQYLDRILARASGAYDILTHHTYNGFVETGYSAFDGDSFFNALEEQRLLSNRASLRQVLDRHAWGREVWITETGYRASPVSDAGERANQATYIRRVLEEQQLRDWWTASFFYELVDCGIDLPGCDIDGFGLTRPSRTPPRTAADSERKPAFEELRRMMSTMPGLTDTRTPACANGRDDDGDGRVDGEDRGCRGTADDDERDDARLRIEVPRLSAAPRTDGLLGEWSRAERTNAPRWSGEGEREELLAELMVGWFEDVLYVAVEVVDDVHAPSEDPAMLWSGDSLQLAFDPGRDFGDAYEGDDHELDFAAARSGPVFHRNEGPADDAEIRMGITAFEGITRYELAIPFTAIGLDGAGDTPGFTFVVNDRDTAARRGWLELTRGVAGEKVPYWFAELELLEGASERDAGAAATDGATAELDAGTDGGTATSDGSGGCGCTTATRPSLGVLPCVVLVYLGRRRLTRALGRRRS